MTVLHSRNADAADATEPDQAPGREDSATADLRDDLGRYAELGAFTLSADTHAWYAAVDTVETPEDARAASTVLAELRGRDLQQVWTDVTALAAGAKVEEPATVAKTALLVELLQRVHRTSTTLITAAYDADLDALAAATADRAWRREHGVKVGFLRGRALRKQAAALVVAGRKATQEELHEALLSAEVERRAWSAVAPEGTLPVPPADGALAEATAAAFEAINTGLRDLARLLPGQDLDALPFTELVDLVERLAADEGTLYRLPTIRTLRTTLEAAGLAALLDELAAVRADRRAAEAAYQRHTGGVDEDAARQALAGGQRDGSSEAEGEVEAAVEAVSAPEVEDEPAVEVEAEAESVTEEAAEVEAEVEAGASEVVEAPVTITLPAPSPAADDLMVPSVPVEAEEEAAAEEPVAEAEASETEVEPEAEEAAAEVAEPAAEVSEPEVEAPVEEPVAEVSEPEVEAPVEEPVAEVTAPEAEEPAAEVVAPEVEPEVEIDEPAAEVAVEEQAEPEVEVEAEPEEPTAEAVEPEVAEPAAEVVEPEPVVEAVAEEPTAEPEAVVEAPAEPEAPVVEEPVAEPEPVVEPEPAVAEEPAEAPAPAAGRPAKPDFTPGRPVTAYSADELLAVVRWVDGDGTTRTDEELLRAAMKELGFARLGPRIKEALGAAVSSARS